MITKIKYFNPGKLANSTSNDEDQAPVALRKFRKINSCMKFKLISCSSIIQTSTHYSPC